MDIFTIPIVAFLLVAPIIFCIWLIPALFIGKSDRTSGNEKLVWIFSVLLISWFAWVLYFFLAPLNKEKIVLNKQ